ncbi:MAG: hypothetical protein CMP51_03765 [Flavobacteriales bacterium]|nr:hypothetical protein [Flavobacteriales bacterium]|tara:strand:- start:3199 stop:5259 length:2061 start_codon:yes stop_codon:yes gene_type:complete
MKKNWVLIILFFVSVSFMFIIVYELFHINLDENIHEESSHYTRIIEAKRGDVLADDGKKLSTTMPVYDIYLDLATINEKLFENNVIQLSKKLSILFGDKSMDEYLDELTDSKALGKRYYKFKRGVSYTQLIQLKKFPIFKEGKNRGGLIVVKKTDRNYPFGSLCKVTIGRVAVNRDNQGADSLVAKNGIELAYNDYLNGIPGIQIYRKMSDSMFSVNSIENVNPKNGMDVKTTINVAFQDIAENALRRQLNLVNAKWGSVVLMDVSTGDIKAIANLHIDTSSGRYFDSKNHAILSSIAPGSTFKLASLMAILEDDYIGINDTIDTGNGKYTFFKNNSKKNQYLIRDTKKGGYGRISLSDVFVKSSNIGISRLIFDRYYSNPDQFISHLRNFGLTDPIETQLWYKSNMIVRDPRDEKWSGTTLPAMSIGYEMRISPLQILTFYNAVANNGKMVAPRFVSSILDKDSIIEFFPVKVINDKICSDNTLQIVRDVLIKVVEEGTASSILTSRYKIAGKTGTCKEKYWMWDKLTKYNRSYTSSFAGFFPADNPKYSCMVVVHDFIDTTDENHYGGQIAAPIFKSISDNVISLDELSSKINIVDQHPSHHLENINVLLDSLEHHENYLIRAESSFLKLDRQQLIDCLSGMELMDAIYLLENSGFEVNFNGIGKIEDVVINMESMHVDLRLRL